MLSRVCAQAEDEVISHLDNGINAAIIECALHILMLDCNAKGFQKQGAGTGNIMVDEPDDFNKFLERPHKVFIQWCSTLVTNSELAIEDANRSLLSIKTSVIARKDKLVRLETRLSTSTSDCKWECLSSHMPGVCSVAPRHSRKRPATSCEYLLKQC